MPYHDTTAAAAAAADIIHQEVLACGKEKERERRGEEGRGERGEDSEIGILFCSWFHVRLPAFSPCFLHIVVT